MSKRNVAIGVVAAAAAGGALWWFLKKKKAEGPMMVPESMPGEAVMPEEIPVAAPTAFKPVEFTMAEYAPTKVGAEKIKESLVAHSPLATVLSYKTS